MSLRPPSRAALLVAVSGLIAPCLLPRPASASGFSIYEQGGRGMGFAGAYSALSDDPSAIFHNAAGIAFLKGKQIYLGGTLVAPKSTFTGDDPFPGATDLETQDAGVIPVPTLYYTQRLRDNLVVGLGIDSPFGLKTQWANENTYSGRFLSLEADLKSLSINPTIAWKLADRFSVGAGLDFRASKVKLRRRVPAINPFTQKVVDVAEVQIESNWNTGIGFNVGLLAKPSDNFSVGLAYRHKVKVDYDGAAVFTPISTGNAQLDAAAGASLPTGSPKVTTAITFPAILDGGAAYHWDNWTLAADVVWFQWSTFDQLAIAFAPDSGLADQTIPENYKSTWQFRVGLERRLTDHWTVRGGYHYDKTPVPVESVTPLLPDQNRHGIAAGGTYTTGRFHVDAGAWYLFLAPRSTEGLNKDRYNGTYDNSAFTVGVSFGYAF